MRKGGLALREQKLPPEYSRQADKFLQSLDKKTEQRLRAGIEKIPLGDIRPYKGKEGYFRLRIGFYRILFRWVDSERIYLALIENRNRAYKKGV